MTGEVQYYIRINEEDRRIAIVTAAATREGWFGRTTLWLYNRVDKEWITIKRWNRANKQIWLELISGCNWRRTGRLGLIIHDIEEISDS